MWDDASTAPRRAFWPRALAFILVALALPLAMGHLAGRFYAPQRLKPTAADLRESDRFVAIFGNSRTEAGLDSERLARILTDGTTVTRARAFTGGGWDAIHFYQLALINRTVLRPGRDAVLIEVSPFSANDAVAGNRLGVIRPEAAWQVAALPGAPVETRLDVLVGAMAALYRYRLAIQSTILAPTVARVGGAISRALEPVGLVQRTPRPSRFQLVTEPGRDYVIKEVRGDRRAFTEVSREQKRATVARLEYGGFKLEALRRAVRALREHGITVYLLSVPVSSWLAAELETHGVEARFQVEMEALARATDARFLRQWPSDFSAVDRFWDDEHMVAASAEAFTAAVAAAIRTDVRTAGASSR